MNTIVEKVTAHCACVPRGNAGVAALPMGIVSHFPQDHRSLLEAFSSVMAFHGYYRLLPLTGNINLTMWNDADTWKFPLSGKLDEYAIFGLNAFGVQYAYNIGELHRGIHTVYEINAEDFSVDPLDETFAAFMEKEFITNSHEPYDSAVVAAHAGLGELTIDDLLLYAPPLLLGGKESVATLNKVDAVSGMTLMADIKESFDKLHDDDVVVGVTTYTDEKGRTRWRIETS